MSHWPIRVQLTLRYFVVFSAAALLLVLSSWLSLRKSLVSTAQSELDERIEDLAGFLQRQPQNATLEQIRTALNHEYAGRDEGKHLLIVDHDGEWLYFSDRRSVSLPLPPLPRRSPSATLSFQRTPQPLQSLSRTIKVHENRYAVSTGLSFRHADVLLLSFARNLLLLTPVLLIMAAIAGHLVSRRALAPVAAISAEARRINETNLSVRLPVSDTRDELQDLSETLNQMLARIDSAFASVRAFTANASHELRTPLSLIRTRVEIALCFARSPEHYKKTLEEVQATTLHMTALLESLLALARADANAEALALIPISLDRLVAEAAEHWEPFARQQGLTLCLTGSEAPAWAMGDVTALRQCVAILMENACRYTERGSIEISLEREADHVTLQVRDTGIGIAPEHIPHLFERFYRGGNAYRENGLEGQHRAKRGSGLGLSLAKWIADRHHAELLVQSRPGLGSCFRLRLPACSPASLSFSAPRVSEKLL